MGQNTPPLTTNARWRKEVHGPRNKAGGNTSVPPSWIFRFIAPPFAAYTSLRFAGSPEEPPHETQQCARHPKRRHAHCSPATAEIVLRCAGSAKRDYLGPSASLRLSDAHCRVARPRRRSASGEKGNFFFFSYNKNTKILCKNRE